MSRRSLALLVGLVLVLGFQRAAWAEGASGGAGSLPPFVLEDASKVEARAARAPAFRGRPELSRESIYLRVVRGSAPMPAYGTSRPAEQIWTLVALHPVSHQYE